MPNLSNTAAGRNLYEPVNKDGPHFGIDFRLVCHVVTPATSIASDRKLTPEIHRLYCLQVLLANEPSYISGLG